MICKAVVPGRVYDVVQRGQLRKLSASGGHHLLNCRRIVFTEHDDDHRFSRQGRADDKQAEQTVVPPGVIKTERFRLCQLSEELSDRLGRLRLQVAFVQIDDAVKPSGGVKSKASTIGNCVCRLDLLVGEPAMGAEGELQFVPVPSLRGSADDRHQLGHLDQTGLPEGCTDYLCFVGKLVLI